MYTFQPPIFVDNRYIYLPSTVKAVSLFVDYRIQSNANNQITLTLSSEALSTTLRSACSPSNTSSSISNAEVVMKWVPESESSTNTFSWCYVRLAKKNDQAVLSFEITGSSRNGRRIRVTQDVRIEVMKLQDVERLAEPMCPEPDVRVASMHTCTDMAAN